MMSGHPPPPLARLAVLACVLVFGPSIAGGLPDWAEAIADAAPDPPDGISEQRSRTLCSETRLTFMPNGVLRVRRRIAAQALRNDAGEVGVGFMRFDEDTQLLRSRAWHLKPEARKATKTRGSAAIDVALDQAFVSDDRLRFLHVDEVRKGSLVFFEFESEERPRELAYLHLFYEGDETLVARFVLELPAGWTARHAWLRTDGPEPVTSDGALVWELRDLKAPKREPMAPSAADMLPMLAVLPCPPPTEQVGPPPRPDWITLARWVEALIRGQELPTPRIESLARELGGGDTGNSPDRIRAAAEYVRDSVRYVAKEIGIGGYRPRAADTVLQTLWGDCKDKGTLLRSILASMGIPSHPILVNSALRETVSEEVPALAAFNHFVVGVPIAEEDELPERYRAALVEAGELGRLLVVDATGEYTSIGWLPAALAGRTGLVVAGERSTLVPFPGDVPGAHRIETKMEADLSENGAASLLLETRRYGESGRLLRAEHAASEQDFRDRRVREFKERWPAGTVENLDIVAEAEQGEFVETVRVLLPAPLASGASDLLELFPGALADLPRVSLRRREAPVRYDYPFTLRYETIIRGVPPGVFVPEQHSASGAGWRVEADAKQEGQTVRGVWELELSRTLFSPEEFDELDDFWKAARRAARRSVSRRE